MPLVEGINRLQLEVIQRKRKQLIEVDHPIGLLFRGG